MNAKQEAKFAMFQSVRSLGNENAEIIVSVPAFQDSFDDFKTLIDEIGATAQRKIAVLTGIAADKSSLKRSLCKTASVISGVVFALAAQRKNNVLKAQTKFVYRDFMHLKDEELAPFCMTIYAEAHANLDVLTDYGVTTVQLAEFSDLINRYQASVPKPRAALVERTTQVANLKSLFKRADEILKERMDKIIIAFTVSHPDFVTRYKIARKIVDARTTATQLKGKITNKAGKTPIENASVTIAELDKTTETDSRGRYLFKPIPKGKYTVKFTHENFADLQTENVEVKQGAINRLNMEAEARPSGSGGNIQG